MTIRRSSAGALGASSAWTAAPQVGQKRADAGSGLEHEAHTLGESAVAHVMQNRATIGFEAPQAGQIVSIGVSLGLVGWDSPMDDLARARARRWWLTKRKVGSLDRAGAFVRDVGFSLLFPNKGVVLPTLYEACSDRPLVDPVTGNWSPEADRVWRWKDELPLRGLAWYGHFVRGRPSFLSPELLADLYPHAGRPDDFEEAGLSPTAYRIARIVYRSGPQSTGALREALDVDGRRASDAFFKAVSELGRALVTTHHGVEDEGAGWATPMLELTARAFAIPRRRDPERARLRAGRAFVDTMLVARPYELGNGFGWGATDARAVLERLTAAGEVASDGSTFTSLALPEPAGAARGARSRAGSRSARART